MCQRELVESLYLPFTGTLTYEAVFMHVRLYNLYRNFIPGPRPPHIPMP